MADVRAFRGVYYNRALVNDLSAVICPPYDIISAQQQQQLYDLSPYNFVRVEFTRPDPADPDASGKYHRAAASLEEWLKMGILKTDDTPAIYLYDQSFAYQGRDYRRRSFMAVVRLEEWSKMIVRPHEDTLSQPKVDRFNLIRKLQANTSPVLALYEDKQRRIASVLAAHEKRKPLMSIRTAAESHTVWAVNDQPDIAEIHAALAGEPLYIADGHHRYESALNYARERRTAAPAGGDQPYDFVLMTLVEFADPGLVILPAHRLVRAMPQSTLNDLKMKLPVFFDMADIPMQAADPWPRVEAALDRGDDVPRLALAGLAKDRLTVLSLRNYAAAAQLMPGDHSEVYKKLDVSILDHVILEKLLGINPKDESCISFTHDMRQAVDRVMSGDAQLAFLLSPVRPTTIKAVADARDRMPRKSTYFFPKLPSGLVMYRLA